MATEPSPVESVNFAWLIRLRWAAIVGQAITILAVPPLLGSTLPTAALLGLVGLAAATNVGCLVVARRVGRAVDDRWLAAVMAFDVLVLTALLYLTGGPYNPFSFVYLVQIALAAVMLRPRWTWALAALSLVCSGVLFVVSSWPLPVVAKTHEEHMRIHLQGMWVAFGISAGFIVYFLLRITRALAAREAELAAAREKVARQTRLESLATLAAGAAHELATPLGTIALVAKELERHLTAANAGEEAQGDARLIREQVERCRAILAQMATDAGASTGEALVAVAVGELVASSVDGLAASPAVRVDISAGVARATVRLPPRAVSQALRGIVKNAQDASGEGATVTVVANATVDSVRIEVRDQGAGMATEVLARAGEPFFTTKAPGRGMGLGIFLGRALAERLGGRLELDSSPGRGTTAVLVLPLVTA